MPKNKAVIFDIDGTAIDSPAQKLPSNRLAEAIRALESNYYICAATGRSWSFAEPVLKVLSLEDPCIISGGTQICDPTSGKILWQEYIDPRDLEAAIEILKQYPEYNVLYNDTDEDTYRSGGFKLKDLDIGKVPCTVLNMIFVPDDIAPFIVAKLSAIEGITAALVVSFRSGKNDIHITNRNATKEHAVAELLKIINVDQKSTVGVGDGHNDIHLFNAVAHKVAMDNAVPELKESADEIIPASPRTDWHNTLRGSPKWTKPC